MLVPEGNTSKAYVLTAGLCFHSIFEGLAVGLSTDASGEYLAQVGHLLFLKVASYVC